MILININKFIIHFGLSNGSNTAAYEASGSSGTARQEGVAVSLVYIGEIECAPPPAAVQRSTPPQLLQNI